MRCIYVLSCKSSLAVLCSNKNIVHAAARILLLFLSIILNLEYLSFPKKKSTLCNCSTTYSAKKIRHCLAETTCYQQMFREYCDVINKVYKCIYTYTRLLEKETI